MATNRDMLSALLDGEADSQMSDPEPASRFMDSPGPHQGFPVRRRPQVQYPPGGFSGLFETTNGLPQAHMRDTVPDWEGAYRDPRPEANLLQSLGMSTSTVPLLSDALSVAGDIQMYKEDPESREWMNYLLTAAGAVPGIPSLAYLMNRGGNAAPNAMRSPGNKQAGAIGYQGSPHKFDALDPSKIGTGEGAQAYGHGAYVAENPEVAGLYRDKLATGASIFLDGQEVTDMVDKFGPAGLALDIGQLHDRNAALAYFDKYIKGSKQDREIVEQFDFERLSTEPGSFLYEIDVPDEDIAKMLDWDAPLSEQPEALKEYMRALDEDGMRHLFEERYGINYIPEEMTGGELHRVLEVAYENDMIIPSSRLDKINLERSTTNKESAAIALEEAGIPGIKYYDQGSRAAGEGTRNMVLFDDLARRAKVLKRNDEILAEPSVAEFLDKLLDDELPLDEASRMQRAEDMGFGEDMYHLTDKDFSEFIPGGPENIDDQGAIFFRPDPSTSASQHNVSFETEGAREMPVKIRGDSPLYIDEYNQKEMRDRYGLGPEFPWIVTKEEAAKLQKLGFTHVEVEDGGKVEEIAVFDPKNIRSKFAKFDPAKKDSAKLLAGAAGAGVLSGLYEPDASKDDEKMRRALLRN